MSSPSTPDPYIALGLSKDATTTQIKATYRKAALKYHPDKVTDESLKAFAADQFHRIQQAYEILGDEERRGRYDAQCRLAELRKDVMESKASKTDVRTAAYEIPTTSPGRSSFKARGPERRTEEVRPSQTSYFDNEPDYFGSSRTSSRKHADYDREFRTYSPKDDADRVKASARQSKENEKTDRRETRRTSEKDRRRERESKRYTPYIEDDSDSDDYASSVNRTSERKQDPYDVKRQRDRYSVYDDDGSDHLRDLTDFHWDYIHRASAAGRMESDRRPSTQRTTSARYAVVEQLHSHADRPAVMVRRSSAQPSSKRESTRKSSGRDRERERHASVPEIETAEPTRRPPGLQSFNSSPAAIKVPSQEPRRTHTLPSKYDAPEYTPQFRRSETMPNVSSSSSRRKDAAPHKSSDTKHNA